MLGQDTTRRDKGRTVGASGRWKRSPGEARPHGSSSSSSRRSPFFCLESRPANWDLPPLGPAREPWGPGEQGHPSRVGGNLPVPWVPGNFAGVAHLMRTGRSQCSVFTVLAGPSLDGRFETNFNIHHRPTLHSAKKKQVCMLLSVLGVLDR